LGIPCGVGHDPDSLSQVGCPELSSGQARPLRVIPCFGQVSENSSDRRPVPSLPFSGEERGHVLHDDVGRSKLANDPGELGPKTRAGGVDSGAVAGAGEVLAREPAADEVDRRELLRADLADVFEALGLGEVAREDRTAVGILLDLPERRHSAALETELEAADPREERADIHPSLPVAPGRCRPSTLKRGRYPSPLSP